MNIGDDSLPGLWSLVSPAGLNRGNPIKPGGLQIPAQSPFITQGIEDNVPVEVMMAQVGHVSAEMTRYYTHLSNGSKDNAVQKIAARNQGVRSVLEMGADGVATGEQPECSTEIASDPQAECASPRKDDHDGN